MGESPKKDSDKWYYKKTTVILGLFIVGPLVLPLIWINPAFSKRNKILITLIIIAISVWLMRSTVFLYKILSEHYEELQRILSY